MYYQKLYAIDFGVNLHTAFGKLDHFIVVRIFSQCIETV
jgi:hypothetical protein